MEFKNNAVKPEDIPTFWWASLSDADLEQPVYLDVSLDQKTSKVYQVALTIGDAKVKVFGIFSSFKEAEIKGLQGARKFFQELADATSKVLLEGLFKDPSKE